MKIIAIRLKNLTSIEGSVEIDFTNEPLCSAGIFAISGPTGAGKSTLLDALCLALYDKAPRFATSVESINLADVGESQINQSDVRNLLRRGVGEGYAEVDFQGVNGHRYRSRWSVRRTRNKANGSLQPQTLEVKDLDSGEELQGSKKELLAQLVERIGLTYEQFTRTVLLAQNDFATFLKSKGAAKAELLEKLTGTSIYSRISQEVFARNKVEQEAVAVIQSKLGMIELLPEEEFRALQREKERQVEERGAGIKLLAELNARQNIVRSLKAQEALLAGKIEEEGREQAKKKSLQEALVGQEEGLENFKRQWEVIQPDLKKARQLDVQIQSQQVVYGQAEQQLKEARQQVAEQEKKHLSVVTLLQGSYQVLNRLVNPVEADSLPLGQAELVLKQEEELLDEQQQRNDKRLVQLQSFGYLSLVEEQSKCQKELIRLQNIRQLTDERTKVQAEVERLVKESAECTRQLTEQETVVKTLQRLYDHARMAVGKDVKALRQQLQEGEACPVCGSLEHPYHGEQEKVDQLYRNIEQEYTAAASNHLRVNNRQVALQRDLSHQQRVEEQLGIQLLTLLEGATVLLKEGATVLKEGTTVEQEEAIKSRLQELTEQIQAYQVLYAAWQKDDESIKKLRTRCESLRATVAQCRLAMQKEAAAKEQLALLQHAAWAGQKRFDEMKAALDSLCRERSLLLKGKSADEAEAVVARREKELNAALEKARKEVETIHNRLSGLQGEMKQLTVAIEEWRGQQTRIESPDQLPEAIEKQQEINLAMERALSSLEARILQQTQNQAAHEQIRKELAERQLTAERWAKLNKLIGSADGAKFKVIAQSYTLNLLLLHANRHLAYLSKRYKLQQVPGTLALQVIDGDMCDEIRTVYSLSGGESFLISLALALGLSSLSSNNLKVESLFIDEGFGSLDADSLRTAMEALEQLQMQGRKIGVISHVQEMSERISVQVQVHKKVNGKSVLTVVG